jgi:hypothetical protein
VNVQAPSRSRVVILGLALLALSNAPTTPSAADPQYWPATSADPTPIASGPATALPDYIGESAKAWPLPNSRIPQNPYLAPNPYGYVHNDTWNSDVLDIAGPLGRNPEGLSSTLVPPRQYPSLYMSGTIGFDSHGHVVLVSLGYLESFVMLVDPVSLGVLSYFRVPGGDESSSLGSSYFYIDHRDQVTIVSGAAKIMTLHEAKTDAGPVLEPLPQQEYDLSALSSPPVPADDRVAGMLVDWQGRIWFETAGAGTQPPRVGIIDPATYPDVKWVALLAGEKVCNGLAITKTAAYVLTSQRIYEMATGLDNQPYIVWSELYDTTGELRPGQYSLGSGTSPTILGNGRFVAITDNATPLKVVVYRTGSKLGPNEKRIVGQIPVFENQTGGAAESSLIGFGLSIIVENNYGYYSDFAEDGGLIITPSAPGLERIDITPDGQSLRKVWSNDEVASTTTAHLSTRTGLIYTVARKYDDRQNDVYYWTAIDFRTGETVWQKIAGTGYNFDSWYAATAIGPTGTIYLSAYGGLIALRDMR